MIVFPSQLKDDKWAEGGSKLLVSKLLFKKNK